ncbi:hypothetical protein [Pseudomonas sp.]|uniref:hypothetical protein n=1 Tax=Pseudomonas sp. TaxID=306 RepID=UPI003F3975AB
MKYANTALIDGCETIVTLLPLDVVPLFDPESPPQPNTYGVPDEVQLGWIKNTDGTFVAPPAAPRVPRIVSRFQARAMLMQASLLEDIEAYMALQDTDAFVRLAWKDVQEFRRDSPLVASIGALFGLGDEQLDDLFRFAATITA